jgi:tRNA 2-selenouridine synthase
VPESLIAAMRASPCLRLELSDDERVQLLLEDYDFFSRDRELFCQRLDALVQLRGREQVEAWQAQVRAGDIEPVVRELLFKHYDPGYASSTERNFRLFAEARTIAPRDRTPEAMRELAQELAAS